MDVSILREDAPLLGHLLEGWDLHGAHAGVLTPWRPVTEPPESSIWCRKSPERPWGLQVMFDEGTPGEWICHRHGDIHLALDQVLLRSPDGIAYLRPEVQLLLKAKDTRPKDDADFATVFPLLSPAPRRWLVDALRRYYPEHRWLHRTAQP
jgi:hypothetical protein